MDAKYLLDVFARDNESAATKPDQKTVEQVTAEAEESATLLMICVATIAAALCGALIALTLSFFIHLTD